MSNSDKIISTGGSAAAAGAAGAEANSAAAGAAAKARVAESAGAAKNADAAAGGSAADGRKKRVSARLVCAILLTAGLIALTVLAATGEDTAKQSWYLPLSIVLSVLAGEYLYLGTFPASKHGALAVVRRVFNTVILVAAPFITFVLLESFNKGFWHIGASLSTETAEPPYLTIILNLIFYYLLFWILSFLTGRFNTGYMIATLFFALLGLVNFYVVKFRGSPLVPWDLLSIRTAGNVANNYTYTVYWRELFSLFGFVFVMLTEAKITARLRKFKVRLPGAAALIAALCLMVSAVQSEDVKDFWGVDTTLFTPNVRYTKNGLVVAWLANLHLIHIEVPDGYSEEAVLAIEQELLDNDGTTSLVEAAASAGGTLSDEGIEYQTGTKTASAEVEEETTTRTASADDTAAAGPGETLPLAERTAATTEINNTTDQTAGSDAAAAENSLLTVSADEEESGAAGAAAAEEAATEAATEAAEAETEAAATAAHKAAATAAYEAGVQPNIIVVMNEAFSDLQVLGEFGTNEDYMPFVRRMMQEYTGGHLMVSVKGGNTANTEWEFLSGDTMAFLPEGSVVFQQYISGEVPTIATYLSSLGYRTVGMHPYLGSGWDRKRVYPLMGFETFLDIKSFTNATKVRKYVSDDSAVDKIIELYEKKDEGTPLFAFEVTMQNHSGYSANASTDNGFTSTITIDGVTSKSTQSEAARRYLTLISLSDASFEKLVTYFESVDEPTIIVGFGDHEPSDYVTEVIADLTGYDMNESLEACQQSYLVPYFVWNNFGVEKDESMNLSSVNYLSAYLTEEAGLPLTAYQEYLLNLRQVLPVICAGTYIDANGMYHSWNEVDSDDIYGDLLNQYNMLTYNHLTDTKNRVDSLFTASAETE